MFFAGQKPTAAEFNTALAVSTFTAGQKVRVSELDPAFTAGEKLRAQALNDVFNLGSGGEGSEPGGGGGGVAGTPANPGEALWIGDDAGKNHFNVGIGETDQLNLGAWTTNDHTDHTQASIEGGFSEDPKFVLTPDASAVKFSIGVNDGRTSSGTQYPRSELRELNEAGGLASWDGGTGVHYMRGRSRVTQVATLKPWVVIFQIHDSSSDLIRVLTETGGAGSTGLRIRARRTPPGGGTEEKTTLRSAYEIGEWLDWEIRVENGDLTVTINDVVVLDVPGGGDTTGCYFKAGCYAQSNTETEDGDSDQSFAVELEAGSFQAWHTGYATPTTPVFTG